MAADVSLRMPVSSTTLFPSNVVSKVMPVRLCELYPNGAKGKRIRKKFATKGEALAFEQHTITKPWQDEKDDNRTLIEVLKIWYYAHGLTLKDADRRLAVMTHASVCMGEPLAREFDAKMFSRYREKRLLGDFSRGNRVKKITPQTINLEQAYFRAVFNELIRLEEWKGENPIRMFGRSAQMKAKWLF